jgi:hypothetical protein
MFRRGVAICAASVLGIAAAANAGAVMRLSLTDMGTRDANNNIINTQPVAGLLNPGQYLLNVYMTSDTTLTGETGLRLLQVDASGPATTVPYDWLGIDIDAINQPIDGVPNFWFNYVGSQFGRFPAQGMVEPFPGVELPSTGIYTDFSNLISGDPPGPRPASTAYGTGVISNAQISLTAGVERLIGALPITVPAMTTAGSGPYTIDLLNEAATDSNRGARLDFGFLSPTTWGAFNNQINYATGAGPITFSVVPEPATLVLLGLGGLAMLRRRKA